MTYQINSNLRMVLANMDDYDDGFDPMLLFFHNGKLLDIKGVIPGIVDVEILEHPVIDGYTVTLIHGDGLRQDNNLIYGDLEEVADYILSLIPSTTPETHAAAQEAHAEPSSPSTTAEPAAAPEAPAEAQEAVTAPDCDSVPVMEPHPDAVRRVPFDSQIVKDAQKAVNLLESAYDDNVQVRIYTQALSDGSLNKPKDEIERIIYKYNRSCDDCIRQAIGLVDESIVERSVFSSILIGCSDRSEACLKARDLLNGFICMAYNEDPAISEQLKKYNDEVTVAHLKKITAEAQNAPTEPSVPSPDVQPSADPEPRPAISKPVSVHIRELASNIAKLCETAIKKLDNGNAAKRAGDNEKAIRYYQAASQKMNRTVEELYELVDADLIDGLKAAAESSFKNNIPAYIGYLCGEFLKIANSYLPSPDSDSASTEPACEFDDGEDPGYQYFDYLFCHILLFRNVSLQFQSRDDLLDFIRSHPGIKLTSFPVSVYRYVAHEQAGHIKNICLSIPYYGKLRPLYCLHDDHVRQTLDFMRSIGYVIRPAGPGEVPPPDIPRSHDFVDVTSEFLKS